MYPRRPLIFWVRREAVALALDRRHLCHAGLAQELGISRSYWSTLFTRRRPLSPQIRRRMLESPALSGIAEEELWDCKPAGDSE